VNEDCKRFNPTNAVNRKKYGVIKYPRARLTKINTPANLLINN